MSATAPTTLRKVMTWLAPALIIVVAVVLIVIAQKDDGAASTPAATSSPSVDAGGEQAGGEGEPDAQPEVDAEAQAAEAAKNRADDDMARRDADDPLAVGDINAPVVLIVYSDYQCAFCAKWSGETQPVLMKDYVEEGKLRIEWRDGEVFGGPDSGPPARAAYAAGLQGKYLTFQEALFKDGEIRPANELTPDALTELALSLALDADQFQIDVESEETAEITQGNHEEAVSLGAFSTPAFLINGIPVMGAQPTEVFTTILDEELAAQK